jgi:hypothetical protein
MADVVSPGESEKRDGCDGRGNRSGSGVKGRQDVDGHHFDYDYLIFAQVRPTRISATRNGPRLPRGSRVLKTEIRARILLGFERAERADRRERSSRLRLEN